MTDDDKLREIIGQAVGAASMCWKPIPTGTFDSTKASEICDGIVNHIKSIVPSKRHPLKELTLDRLQEAQDTIENVTNGVGTIIGERVMETIKAAIDDVTDLNAGFMLRWDADMRAIKRWHEGGGDELTWPDHADLCIWLMERVDSMEKALLNLHNEAILSEGQMVKITGLPRVEVRRKADELKQ